MDIQEKQARWALEKPLFEAEFIHSHLLPFFNFNENTGDYEIKSEFSEDEDQKVAYETLNTGWVMWLRAKRAKAQSVPYEPGSFKSSHEIIINETKSELIDGYDIAKEDEYLLESLVYRGVCIGKAQAVPEGFVLVEKAKLMQIIGSVSLIEPITRGNPYMDSVKRELTAITDVVKTVFEAQEQKG